MEKLYLIKFDEKNESHISIRECEIINTYSSGYEVETGVGIDFVHKEEIDNFNLYFDEFITGIFGYFSNNSKDTIDKFKKSVYNIFKRQIKLTKEKLKTYENLLKLVGV